MAVMHEVFSSEIGGLMPADIDGEVLPTSFYVNGQGDVDFTLIEGGEHQPADPERGEEEIIEDDAKTTMRLGQRTFRWFPTELVTTLVRGARAGNVSVGGYVA
jgi:hypothetical protein